MGQKTLELISLVPWTIVAQWCNLLILFLLVRKFLFKPVQNILAKREAEISESYEAASTAKAEAEAMRADYEERLSEAREEANTMLREATVRAQTRGDELLNDAQRKSADLLQKAERDIAQEKRRAMGELKNEISGIAVSLAEKVIEREVDPASHEKLIEQFIAQVGDAS